VLIAVSGCGGGDDSPSESSNLTPTAATPTLSKADFISQADDICAEVNAAVGTVDSGTTDAASAVGQKADLYEGMIERIKGLGDAASDSALSDFFSSGDDLVQAEKDAQLAAERGDDAGLATAESDASTALSSFQSAAQSYGFQECGQGPSAPTTSTPGVPATGTVVPPTTTTPGPVAPAPAAPVAPAPPPPAPPSGGAGTGGGAAGGGSSGGGSSGSGGIGPG
jgi:hypothetical protein